MLCCCMLSLVWFIGWWICFVAVLNLIIKSICCYLFAWSIGWCCLMLPYHYHAAVCSVWMLMHTWHYCWQNHAAFFEIPWALFWKPCIHACCCLIAVGILPILCCYHIVEISIDDCMMMMLIAMFVCVLMISFWSIMKLNNECIALLCCKISLSRIFMDNVCLVVG